MSIVARGLARGVAAGFIVAAGLGLGTAPVEPPVPPALPDAGLSSRASAWAPGATMADEERAMIERQNQVILALVMSAVNSRILE